MTVSTLFMHANCLHFAAHDQFNGVIPSLGGDAAVVAEFALIPEGEPLPQNGRLKVPDAPGFGMQIADRGKLVPLAQR